MNHSELDRTLR
ncbi:hypothetical protein F383_35735 [Gossypium arboreum]|uniref:Uncharacterized protein n=1 Tax=Gossypium arboreum TaxID=29729 RepID=A0A0B0PXP8_GOSAR|nr:hypothetical protein F383_35735 [Gossypium arboreum]